MVVCRRRWGPMMVKTSPLSTAKLTPSTALIAAEVVESCPL